MYSIRPTIHGRSADRVRMFFPATEGAWMPLCSRMGVPFSV